jgi:hypothetical protein
LFSTSVTAHLKRLVVETKGAGRACLATASTAVPPTYLRDDIVLITLELVVSHFLLSLMDSCHVSFILIP